MISLFIYVENQITQNEDTEEKATEVDMLCGPSNNFPNKLGSILVVKMQMGTPSLPVGTTDVYQYYH